MTSPHTHNIPEHDFKACLLAILEPILVNQLTQHTTIVLGVEPPKQGVTAFSFTAVTQVSDMAQLQRWLNEQEFVPGTEIVVYIFVVTDDDELQMLGGNFEDIDLKLKELFELLNPPIPAGHREDLIDF